MSPEQDVLRHVHREQVLLAERVDGRDEGDQQHEDAAAEREPLTPAGAAPACLGARLAEAPHVDAAPQREREEDRRVEGPVDDRVWCVKAIDCVICPAGQRASSVARRAVPISVASTMHASAATKGARRPGPSTSAPATCAPSAENAP